MISQPCFLIGAERSGTTLLRLMLDHHPDVSWHSEFEFAVDQIAPDGSYPEVADYVSFLKSDGIFKRSAWQISEQLDYVNLVDSFLQQKKGGKRVIGATVHRHFCHLLRIWPEASFIYLLRDGRDVGKSRIGMGWAGNMWCAMDGWLEAEREWDELRPLIGSSRWIEVRYEDLVRTAEATLSDICQFLGTTFDAAMFDYSKISSYGLPDPQLASQWKIKQTREEIQLAEARARNRLLERGYPLSGLPELVVSPAKERDLQRQDRVQRLKFRIQRFGLPLTAAEFACRQLRVRWAHRLFQNQMNRMSEAFVK